MNTGKHDIFSLEKLEVLDADHKWEILGAPFISSASWKNVSSMPRRYQRGERKLTLPENEKVKINQVAMD